MENWHILVVIGVLAYAPGLFWLWYFFKKDLEPEPLHLIRNCFVFGMVAVVPAGAVELLIPVPRVFMTTIGAPIIEETAKFLAVYLSIYRHAEFDEPMDGVVYAVAVALGFASLENALYLYSVNLYDNGSLPLVMLVRSVFSVPAHALFAVMWGYPLGVAKFSEDGREKRLVQAGLLLGMLFHGIFNFLTLLGPLWPVGMLVVVVFMWQMTHRRIQEALAISPHAATDSYKRKLRALKPTVVSTGEDAWYHNRAVVLLLLFLFCFPAGLYGLVKTDRFSRTEKLCIVVLWVVMLGTFAYVAE